MMAVHPSEARVAGGVGSESAVTAPSVYPEDGPEAESVAESGGVGDRVTSTLLLVETATEESVGLESNLFEQLSLSRDLTFESASSVDDGQTRAPLTDQDSVKPPEVVKPQLQTTQVQEVQWSDFGALGGYGSFSDFLSEFPADSSQQQGTDTLASNPDDDFFHFSQQSPAASSIPGQQYDNGSFFRQQQPYPEGNIGPVKSFSDVSTSAVELQVSVQRSSEEQASYLQSHAVEQHVESAQSDGSQLLNRQSQEQEPQIQSDQLTSTQWHDLQLQGQEQQTQNGQFDQGHWQELPEYPGWLYNTLNGEWVEKTSIDAGTGSSWHYPSGQYHSQHLPGENTHWQGHESTVSPSIALEQTVSAGATHVSQTMGNVPQNVWKGDQHGMGQSNITHNPLFEEALVQPNGSALQESAEQVSSTEVQSSWEDQYPGWYYDHQAQEWRQYRQTSQDADPTAAQVCEQQSVSTSLSVGSYDGQVGLANGFSQAQNVAGWSSAPDRQYTAGVQNIQDPLGSHDALAGSLLKSGHSLAEAQIAEDWTGVQQLANSSSYYHSGQPQLNGPNQVSQVMQQTWGAPYGAQHIDAQTLPHSVPEIHYNQFQASGYMSQPWSAVKTYQTERYPQYAPQTPPKSMEEALRTSVGRPPHVLMSFGFGGKLVVMKLRDPLSLQSSDGNQSFASGQAWVPGPIHLHNLSQLVPHTADIGGGVCGSLYFGALGRSTFTGPLAGGSVSSKDLSKWLDDRATNCQSEEPNSTNPSSLAMLWGLLKLACQHYGKLRSAPGTAGIISQDEDGPEAALAKLLTSGSDQSSWTMGSLVSTVCLQPMPSDHQLQATASEIKKLLVAGKRKEALQHAQQGQLWGPALVLARQLGEKYYTDTVAEMAQRQFLPGSPLRTLSLLLAGQPAEVFSGRKMPAVINKQPMQVPTSIGDSAEDGLGSMLEEWPENLSIMAANRTNGDDRVISHLGDCLWKVKDEVAAAHICYLVADGGFESFSSTARLCLIGADHWKNPRTYATPEAIQRTEVYEYAKVLGNPQFILVPFQPYKLIYASMLAEAGKTGEALRYCQAVLKILKTAGRALEVETCRQAALSLEERLRCHAQSGQSVNLAPGKLVRGFLSALDRGIHGIIGGPPPPTGQEQVQIGAMAEAATLQDHLSAGRYGTSPSRPPAPLGPSASAGKLKETGRNMPQRSVSEPDFSATMKEKSEQGKPSTRGYLGRFGAVFSRAGGLVNMVAKTHKNEAKLGDENKFYYDEKLKRWVEEGAAVAEEETAPPPPPMAMNFVNKNKIEDSSPDGQLGMGSGVSAGSKSAYLGTPPVPPNNQFSARTRQQGVRSRYVDTFNKGGNSTPSKPAVSTFAPVVRAGGTPLQPMSFFVPGPSIDSSNGSVSNPENGTTLLSREANGHYPDATSNMENRVETNQYAAAQNLFHGSGQVDSSMQQVLGSENTTAFGTGTIQRFSSSENTTAFGAVTMQRVSSSDNTSAFGADESQDGNGRSNQSPSHGDIGFSNGYHARANSWSGYPSDFQALQTETNLSSGNPSTKFSMYNGFPSQGTVNTSPSVGSYFQSPPKVDIYKPDPSPGIIGALLSPPPSVASFIAATVVGEMMPGALDPRSGIQTPASLVGDDLQEVEL